MSDCYTYRCVWPAVVIIQKILYPGCCQHFSSLGELDIQNCEGLEEMFMNEDAIMWKALNERLHSLTLRRFDKLEALPQGIQHLTSLKQLKVSFLGSLESIPEWISNLKSLKTLEFWSCPKLTSLPEGIRSLVSLKKLFIFECPILSKRCKMQIGEDWPKVAHIQDLDLLPDPNEDDQNLSNQQKKIFVQDRSLQYIQKFWAMQQRNKSHLKRLRLVHYLHLSEQTGKSSCKYAVGKAGIVK